MRTRCVTMWLAGSLPCLYGPASTSFAPRCGLHRRGDGVATMPLHDFDVSVWRAMRVSACGAWRSLSSAFFDTAPGLSATGLVPELLRRFVIQCAAEDVLHVGGCAGVRRTCVCGGVRRVRGCGLGPSSGGVVEQCAFCVGGFQLVIALALTRCLLRARRALWMRRRAMSAGWAAAVSCHCCDCGLRGVALFALHGGASPTGPLRLRALTSVAVLLFSCDVEAIVACMAECSLEPKATETAAALRALLPAPPQLAGGVVVCFSRSIAIGSLWVAFGMLQRRAPRRSRLTVTCPLRASCSRLTRAVAWLRLSL